MCFHIPDEHMDSPQCLRAVRYFYKTELRRGMTEEFFG